MKNKKILFSALFMFGLLAFSGESLADSSHCSGGTQCTATTKTACEAIAGCGWVDPITPPASGSGATTLTNPLGAGTTVYSLIGRIVGVVLGLVGSIALLMFIYGGVLWMTSAGSADRVKKGREAILWSIIGMAVIFASYGLTRFLIEKITTSPS